MAASGVAVQGYDPRDGIVMSDIYDAARLQRFCQVEAYGATPAFPSEHPREHRGAPQLASFTPLLGVQGDHGLPGLQLDARGSLVCRTDERSPRCSPRSLALECKCAGSLSFGM
jgi:hypothetical protein